MKLTTNVQVNFDRPILADWFTNDDYYSVRQYSSKPNVVRSAFYTLSIVLFVMARFAYWNEPFNWFFSDIVFCISLMMNLCRPTTAIYATPIVSFKDNIPFSFPCFRFEIVISVIVTALFAFGFKYPNFDYWYSYDDD